MSNVESNEREKKQSNYKRTRGLAIKCEQLFRMFRGEITLIISPPATDPRAANPLAYFSNPDHPMASQIKNEYPLATILVPDSFEYVPDNGAARRKRKRDTPKQIRIKSTGNPRRRSPLKKAAGNSPGPDATPTRFSLPPRPQRPRSTLTSKGEGPPGMPPRPERPHRVGKKLPSKGFADLPPRPLRPNFETARSRAKREPIVSVDGWVPGVDYPYA